MLTRMTDEDWAITVEIFRAAKSRRGEPGRDDRKFLEPLFHVHSITWRALPVEFGNWNSVLRRLGLEQALEGSGPCGAQRE